MKPLTTVSEVTISYANRIPVSQRPRIHPSKDAEQIFRSNWSNDLELVEECYMLLLNKANMVTGIFHVSRGGMTGTIVDIKIILVTALKSLAAGVILAHNHPSGSLQPSQADVDLTKRLKNACALLDIAFLDHLILTTEDYYSLSDMQTGLL